MASSLLPAVVYFEYSTDPSFVGSSRTPDQVVEGATLFYYATATGLSPSTYYYYRMVGVNAAGTSYSPPFQFVEIFGVPVFVSIFTTNTAAGYPVAGTGAVVSITQSSAEIQSWIQSASQPATVYFEWDTDFEFSNASRTPLQSISPTPLNGTGVNFTLTGLAPATTYFYRSVATNATGTSIGIIYAFRTLP
jgi:phosphodiesterase/alkaline phosphatase D-like protein